MDDRYDLVGFFLSKDGLLRSGLINLLEGTPLEESAGSLSFAVATFALVNVVFLLLFFSQFAILWIERKAVARMQDRYGATTALRSLWVGENGVTAGEWWNMLPFGLGETHRSGEQMAEQELWKPRREICYRRSGQQPFVDGENHSTGLLPKRC